MRDEDFKDYKTKEDGDWRGKWLLETELVIWVNLHVGFFQL